MSLGIVMSPLVSAGLVGLLTGIVWTVRSWASGKRVALADRRATWAAIVREMPPGTRLTAVEPGSCMVVEPGDSEQHCRETRGGR